MIVNKEFHNIPSITFFFPYKGVGGVSVLFLRLSKYIAENYGIQTYLIDYPDGYMSQCALNNPLIQYIYFEEGSRIYVPEGSVLVFESRFPYLIPSELIVQRNTKTIFWTLYPFNLLPLYIKHLRDLQCKSSIVHKFLINFFMLPLKKKLCNLIATMGQKRSLFFMDKTTLNITSDRLGIKIENPIFIPVPCDDDVTVTMRYEQRMKRQRDDSLSVCWIGRLETFKTHILIYTMQKLSRHALENKLRIYMHIIGDGSDARFINESVLDNQWFQKINVGTLSGPEMRNYLKENVDVVTAMGTSALEGAQLRIPSILLDFSYGPINGDYKFKWLFESSGYSLGDAITENHFEEGNKSLELIIASLKSNYDMVAKQCFDYYINNHSMNVVCYKFLDALENASFRYEDFDPNFLKKSAFMKSYESFKGIYYHLVGFPR